MGDDPVVDAPEGVDDATDRMAAMAARQVVPEGVSLLADDPVRSLLDELDLQGSVTSLDMRLADLEHRLRTVTERVELAGRRQAGELDMMRARIADMIEMVSGEDEAGADGPDPASAAVRPALHPAVDEQTTLADDQLRELLDQLDVLRVDVQERTASVLEELERSLAAVRGELSAGLDDEASQRRVDLDELEKRLNGRVDVASEADSEGRRRLDDRIEALRRELDAASGELRAHVAVALGDITERIDQLAERLLEPSSRGPAGDDTVVMPAAHASGSGAGQLGGFDRDEVSAALASLTARMDALQSTVAHAINDIANSLGQRLAALTSRVDAMEETTSRQRQQHVDHESLVARLALLEERVGESAPHRGLADQVGQLQRELVRLAGRLDSFARQAVAADERAEALRRDLGVLGDEVATAGAWRSELRDLTARTTELAARVAEAETIARRAGNAVIEALRRARAAVERDG